MRLTAFSETEFSKPPILKAKKNKEEANLKVRIELSPEVDQPYAVIYAKEMNAEIEHVVALLQENKTPIIGQKDDRLNVLKAQEVYMVRIEQGKTIIYGKTDHFSSKKRLYELKDQLGDRFMQVSKAALINLDFLDHVDSGFAGAFFITLKNGLQEYVSRTYLPEFKRYLGL